MTLTKINCYILVSYLNYMALKSTFGHLFPGVDHMFGKNSPAGRLFDQFLLLQVS